MSAAKTPFAIRMVGDLILGEPEPDSFFDATRAALRLAELVIGHVEVPHTRRGRERAFDIPSPKADPDHLAALGRAGFHAVTLGGNHVFDHGPEGIEDTVAALSAADIASCGAGLDLDAARQAVQLERGGMRIGLLSYNCVGPRDSWAGSDKAGCAYIRIVDPSGNDCSGPGASAFTGSAAHPESIDALQRDIARLAETADLVIVALHKGIVHTPALLADYERPLARAAVEAGAAVVIGHHSHILRGVETVDGAPVFHGLGNFVTVTRALDLDTDHPVRREWARKRRELFGFEPDPNYPTFPFHPEARHAIIGDCRVDARGRISPGFLPCFIRPSGQPELLGNDARGQALLDYVAAISRAAGLRTEFAWEGERVVFQ